MARHEPSGTSAARAPATSAVTSHGTSQRASQDASQGASNATSSSPRLVALETVPKQCAGRIEHLSVIESVPFALRRVFWITGTDVDTVRGDHAHKALHQLIVPVVGECRAIITGGAGVSADFHLVASDRQGLYVPPLHWLILNEFSPGTALMVAASDVYDPDDYIHDREAFRALGRA